MSRKRTNKLRTHILIDEEVNAKLRILLTDPKTGRLRYGALHTLINSLLRIFVNQLTRPDVDVVEMLRRMGIDVSEDEVATPADTDNATPSVDDLM